MGKTKTTTAVRSKAESSTKTTPANGNEMDTNKDTTEKTSLAANGNGHVNGNGHSTNGTTVPKDSAPQKTSNATRISLKILRSILLDVPLMLLFLTYISLVILQNVHDTYLVKQAKLMEWPKKKSDRRMQEMTYYNRRCNDTDLTTTDVEDLVITPDFTPTEALHHQLKHGASIYPNVLSDKTADELRDYIVDRNKKEKGFWVISGKHRYSFGIRVHEPIVAKALSEIASNPVFRPAIEKVCGRNPSVIEFTGITASYGAEDQFWHQDVLPSGSAYKHARNFVPSYSLFIPLQNTTAAMGATQICPGSHVCDGQAKQCERRGFRASGKADNWPKAAGALVNQQTHHRGMAHTDPNGPDRVLFILTFAPRPRHAPGQVETRQISQGGSYSMDWHNWGHTIQDFGNALVEMREPWLTLRSLGLWKFPHQDWGWDWVAQATMRIANNDNGYNNYEAFAEAGGLGWLPRFLQADVENDDDGGWPEYIKQTIVKCKDFAQQVNIVVIGSYLGLLVILQLIHLIKRGKKCGFVLGRGLLRLVITHALVALLGLWVWRTICSTQWAKNIEHSKLYHHKQIDASAKDEYGPPTLPYLTDVLVETRYNSRRLGGYTKILDITHPANKQWKSMISQNSDGYRTLPPTLQAQLSTSVVDWTAHERGRFLTQNCKGDWTQVSPEKAARITHVEFSKASHSILNMLLTELDYLKGKTQFDAFRDFAIHRKTIPKYLQALSDKLTKPPFEEVRKPRLVTSTTKRTAASKRVGSKMPPRPTRKTIERPRPTSLPPRAPIEEPYEGAWVKQGDIVDGKYNGNFNEWYRAEVVKVNADQEGQNFDVLYDDGELDKGLCRKCVKPYKSLELEEVVSIRDSDDEAFIGGRIVKIHEDGTYDIDTELEGLREGVDTGDIRRSGEPFVIEVGSEVEARFQGTGKKWYPGVITEVNDDGTYNIDYDDGDREVGVEEEHIRPAPE